MKYRTRVVDACKVLWCTHEPWSRGWCITHYSRWRKHGDPLHPGYTDPIDARLLRGMERQENGCWLWTGALLKGGYGQIGYKGHATTAHRVSYEFFVGPIKTGFVIDHLCHNADLTCRGNNDCQHRRCMNPDHLEQVTPAENRRRMAVRLEALYVELERLWALESTLLRGEVA